ncbi:endonuclease-reverse transcriptase domain-containing protein [Ditylenchus destructor]|uniref:Endonuclease-reverse transcriptase domain-containing protein n=1 Tax=Ditylenchus destructor TaxID=166010 RepID=A0AAD4RA23_9BILA|nr:endonuclease-reverse transcriptase domain-containing protein [Ditylenchus destructor]
MRRWSRPSNRTGDYSKNGRTGATRPKLRLITLNLGNAGLGVERQNQARTNEIMRAMEKVKFDIIGLSETHTQKAMKSEKWTDGQLAGAEIHTSKQDGKIGGVGFIVHKEMTKFVQEVRLISHRIATLQLKLPKQRPLKIIQVYAPHSGYDDEEIENFYSEVEQHLDDPRKTTIIMGDFNAKLGPRQGEEWHIGSHSAETRNNSGDKLAAFAHANHFYVMNGFFEKPISKRWTWRSNMPQMPNSEIDYILSNSKQLVTNVEVISQLDVRSDHKAVRATLNMEKGKVRKTRPQKEILEPTLKESIKAADWKSSERRITRRYEEFLSTLKKCLTTAEKEKAKNHCPRITDDTAKMLKALAEEKRKGTNPQECKRLSKSVRKKLESDYEEYKTKKLLETAEQRKSLKQCQEKNGWKPRKTEKNGETS